MEKIYGFKLNKSKAELDQCDFNNESIYFYPTTILNLKFLNTFFACDKKPDRSHVNCYKSKSSDITYWQSELHLFRFNLYQLIKFSFIKS